MTQYEPMKTTSKGVVAASETGVAAAITTLAITLVRNNNPDAIDDNTAMLAVSVGTAVLSGLFRAVSNWWKHRTGGGN